MVDVHHLQTPGLGNRTYLITDSEVAVVIDPPRDVDRVTALLDEVGARLTHVLETHVHNDYVSGGLALAREWDARYVVAAGEAVGFAHEGVVDGEAVASGALRLVARHTPGHTPGHLAYVLHDEADGGRAVGVFTGGSLLYGTVGRTDLVSPTLTEALTRAQHRSAHRLVADLAEDVVVHPTHGFGSFCSSAPGTDTEQSTIGEERRSNAALQTTDEDEFVATLVSGLTAYPRYYAHMAPRNRVGAEPLDLSAAESVNATELRRRLHSGEWVVDVRDRGAFASRHLAGTVNVELGDPLATYLGWTLPWGSPVTLVADTSGQVAEAQRMIARIGIDRPAGQATGGPDAYADGDVGSYDRTDFAGVAKAAADGDVHVLDVRRDDEWADGHVAGAQHVPLPDLEVRMGEVPADRPVWVHCASGYRASVGASLLARAGRTVVLIDDEFDHAAGAGLEITT